MDNIEARLRELGVVQKKEFITAAGHQANRKIELEDVSRKDPLLAADIIGLLAIRLHLYRPDVVIGVPTGANDWASGVAHYLKIKQAKLDWVDKKAGKLSPASASDAETIGQATRAALVDDVWSTGGTVDITAKSPGIDGKVVAAGVIWKRNKEPTNASYPVEAIVESHVPFIENE